MKNQELRVRVNAELVEMAKIYLDRNDYLRLSEVSGIPEGVIYNAARGRGGIPARGVDLIQKAVCQKHKSAVETAKRIGCE